MYWVYILESEKNTRYYIGQTNSIEHRLAQHNNEQNKGWSARYKPWKVVYSESFSSRTEAIKKETQLKRLKNRSSIEKYIAGWSSSSSSGS